MASPTLPLYSAGESTSAGRRLACSLPFCGLKSSHTTSPRSGTGVFGPAARGERAGSQQLPPDGRAGVDFVVDVFGRDPGQQLGKPRLLCQPQLAVADLLNYD